MTPELDEVGSPTYLNDLDARSTEDLRAMRRHCADLENSVSYVRRLAQGRLDLISGAGDSENIADLVARLPELLGERVRGSGSGRLAEEMEIEPPMELVEPLLERLDEAAGPSLISDLAELNKKGRAKAKTALKSVEDELSAARQLLHGTIDRINDELARRYQSGESPGNDSRV